MRAAAGRCCHWPALSAQVTANLHQPDIDGPTMQPEGPTLQENGSSTPNSEIMNNSVESVVSQTMVGVMEALKVLKENRYDVINTVMRINEDREEAAKKELEIASQEDGLKPRFGLIFGDFEPDTSIPDYDQTTDEEPINGDEEKKPRELAICQSCYKSSYRGTRCNLRICEVCEESYDPRPSLWDPVIELLHQPWEILQKWLSS